MISFFQMLSQTMISPVAPAPSATEYFIQAGAFLVTQPNSGSITRTMKNIKNY